MFWAIVVTSFFIGICSGMFAFAGPPMMLLAIYHKLPKRIVRVLATGNGILHPPFRCVLLIMTPTKAGELPIDWSLGGNHRKHFFIFLVASVETQRI